MRYCMLLLLLALCVSCRNTWTTETKNNFYLNCNTKNLEWAKTPARTQEYCDCVFLTMTRKYPVEEEAMRKMDSVLADPDVLSCRQQVEQLR